MITGDFPVRSRANAERYGWGGPDGDTCDGWHLLRSAELSVIEERMPPGSAEVRHWHRRARQFFYVVAGELTMETDSGDRTLRTGDGLEIPPGCAHRAVNRASVDARFLVVSQPPARDDRVYTQ